MAQTEKTIFANLHILKRNCKCEIESIACSPSHPPDRHRIASENRVDGKIDFNLKSKYVYYIFYMWFRLENYLKIPNTSFVVVVGRFIINYTCANVRACFQYIAEPFCHFCANSNAKFRRYSISVRSTMEHIRRTCNMESAHTDCGNNSYRPQNFARSHRLFRSFIF